MAEDLQQLRAAIDALDVEILKLINQRAAHAQTIGRLKNGTVYRPEREAQVLRRIKELNPERAGRDSNLVIDTPWRASGCNSSTTAPGRLCADISSEVLS